MRRARRASRAGRALLPLWRAAFMGMGGSDPRRTTGSRGGGVGLRYAISRNFSTIGFATP